MEEKIGCGKVVFTRELMPAVLILIVVEERIGFMAIEFGIEESELSLNPYCSGRKNRMSAKWQTKNSVYVLILIVMEERIGFLQI